MVALGKIQTLFQFIDESSMLTEEMFGAVLDAVGKYAGRIIFVGDTNQLPPIGAGRPFVDLERTHLTYASIPLWSIQI